MASVTLEAAQLYKRYGGRTAVDDISFVAHSGGSRPGTPPGNAVGVAAEVATMEWIRDRITGAVTPEEFQRLDDSSRGPPYHGQHWQRRGSRRPGRASRQSRHYVQPPLSRQGDLPDEWMIDLGIDFFDEPFRNRLEQRMVTLTAELLALNGRVIIEFGSSSRRERDQLLAVGRGG